MNNNAFHTLAAEQHGAVTLHQLRAVGMTDEVSRKRVSAGELVLVHSRVLVLAGSPDTAKRRAVAATLQHRGAVSHRSAAGFWGVAGFLAEPVEVTRLRGGRLDHDLSITVHEPRKLEPHHLTVLDGVKLTTPSRTLFDLAGIVNPGRLERALDSAWAMRLVRYTELRSMLEELGCRGRSGIVAMRELLDARSDHHRPPESGLESRFEEICRHAGVGLDEFERQVDVGGDDRWTGRSDFRHRRLPIVVFVDSERYHSAFIDCERDRCQTAELELGGFVVVRVTDVDVWHRPALVLAKLRDARSAAQIL